MEKNNVKATFLGNAVTLLGKETKVGEKAPDFTVVAGDLSEKKLSDYAGKTKVILVYPSIDTSVCATQNRTFNKRIDELGSAVVLSISVDLPFAQKRFCGAEGIDNVITASDFATGEFGKNYGLELENGPLAALHARAIVVVDANGVVKHTELVADIASEPNYDAAIAAI